MKFEDYTLVDMDFVVFWVVVPCNVVVGYQHFRGPCCLHLQGWSAWWMDNGHSHRLDM